MSWHPWVPFAKRLDLDDRFAALTDFGDVFGRLQQLPYCVWLDSASDRQQDRGRYSFLSADPIGWHCTEVDSPNPWPVLEQWCGELSRAAPVLSAEEQAEMPPFCGGIVALLAYEAAWWLEPGLRETAFLRGGSGDEGSANERTGVPGIAMGLYDWTLAIDHHCGHLWLLSTGLNETFQLSRERAQERSQDVIQWLATGLNSATAEPPDAASCRPPKCSAESYSKDVWSNFSDAQFAAGVAEIVAGIKRGDSFQVNLAQTLTHRATCPASVLYEKLRGVNPAPYACYFDTGDYQVISSSPEGFLQVRPDASGQRCVVTRPIKGTVARTGEAREDARLGAELLASEKDRAENIMIVDLMRNDLSRVCLDASVQVSGLCELERYQRVQHLVSTVRGVLRPDASIADLLAACFPGGSITGAPKVQAMRTIARLEQRPRGPYCGSLGYISLSGAADFNILIRTVTQRMTPAGEAIWEFPVGGGITAQSDPQRETQETWIKAASLLEAIAAAR